MTCFSFVIRLSPVVQPVREHQGILGVSPAGTKPLTQVLRQDAAFQRRLFGAAERLAQFVVPFQAHRLPPFDQIKNQLAGCLSIVTHIWERIVRELVAGLGMFGAMKDLTSPKIITRLKMTGNRKLWITTHVSLDNATISCLNTLIKCFSYGLSRKIHLSQPQG